ncbi:MAG: DNA cytosine methyltransferase [Aggregatilineales bacterium]
MRLEENMSEYEAQSAPETTRIEKSSVSRIHSMIDLFAGCGGLSLGFENAGFTPVFVNELNQDALSTYLLNREHSLGGIAFSDNAALHSNDAHELEGKRLEQLQSDLSNIHELDLHFEHAEEDESGLDIIAGGPPCQGYSGIGHRRSYGVDKKDLPSNTLYVRMVQIIKTLRPKIFLFENVRGLLNSRWTQGGSNLIWPDVLAEFRSIRGYEVRWNLVHARDYGVPQNRPRVLLVGIRRDIVGSSQQLNPRADTEDAIKCGFLPPPQANNWPHLYELLGDLIDPKIPDILASGDFPSGTFETTKYPHRAMTPIQKHLRSAPPWWEINRTVQLTEQEYSRHSRKVFAKFSAMLQNGGTIPEEFKTKKFSQRLLPAQWGLEGPTITVTSMPDDYVHFSQPRTLTVREWARIQLFPDWYRFAGKRTTGGIRRAGNPLEGIFDREVPKYTQIGNAVPVGLAEKVGNHLKSIIDEVSR